MLMLNTIRESLVRVANRLRGPINVGLDPIIDPAHVYRGIDEEMRTFAGASSWRHSVYSDNFTMEDSEMRQIYRKWAAEPSVKSALKGKVLSVCALGLQVTATNKDNPRDREIADSVRASLLGVDGGWVGLGWEVLVHATMDGWSICNKVYKEQDRGRFRGQRVLHKVKAKDTRFIIPLIDPYRNIIGLYNQQGNFAQRFDPSKFLVFTHDKLFQNPTGISDLRGTVRAMKMIPAILKLRMIFLDKYSGPFLAGKISDKSLRQRMAAELSKARGEGYIVLDSGSSVEAIELATRGTGEFQQALEDLRQEAVTGVAGAYLHQMTGTNPNARGDSSVQSDTTDIFVWALAEQLAALINQCIVPEHVDYNYGAQAECPIVSLEATNPKDVVDNLAIDESLDRMGVDTSAAELLDRAGRSPPKDPSDSVQGQKAKRAQVAGGFPGPGGDPFGTPTPAPGPVAPPPAPPTLFAELSAGGLTVVPAAILSRLANLPVSHVRDDSELELIAFDSFAEAARYTGDKVDSLGRKLHYVNGKRVATAHELAPVPKPPAPTPAPEPVPAPASHEPKLSEADVHAAKAITDEVIAGLDPAVAAYPSIGHRIAMAVAKAYVAFRPAIYKLALLSHEYAGDVLDTAQDYEKITYSKMGQHGQPQHDPIYIHTGVPANVAFQVISKAVGIGYKLATKNRQTVTSHAEPPDPVNVCLEVIAAYRQAGGIPDTVPMPTRDEVAAALAAKQAARNQ